MIQLIIRKINIHGCIINRMSLHSETEMNFLVFKHYQNAT